MSGMRVLAAMSGGVDSAVAAARAADAGHEVTGVHLALSANPRSHRTGARGCCTLEDARDARRAADGGLAVAAKPDSHDVCFIPDGDTRAFLAGALGRAPGPIVDTGGAVLGSHDGAYGFTVGQRRGLRVGTPAADGRPRYVLDIEPASGTVTVGPAESPAVTEIGAERPVWTGCAPPAGPLDCLVQLRAHGQAHPATVIPGAGLLRIVLAGPAR